MKLSCALCGLLVLVALVSSEPVAKREAQEDISPLNEVYIFETDDDQSADGDRADRDKRKVGVGVVKLGVTNGIINFVFGKLDSFLDAKTKALHVLDESNRVKNAAFGIDNTHSATSEFLHSLVSQKVQAATGSIGPLINSAQTLVAGTKGGFTGALISKLAPLSSISSGVAHGLAAGPAVAPPPKPTIDTTAVTAAKSGAVSAALGGLLSQKLTGLSSLSQAGGHGGVLSGGLGTGHDGIGLGVSAGASSHGGIGGAGAGHLGAFANLGGEVSTTTEDIPEFDRNKVSLDIPPEAFGTGFTLITNVSKVLSSVIFNSAKRTQTLLEIFKPFFRGTLVTKGLSSDH